MWVLHGSLFFVLRIRAPFLQVSAGLLARGVAIPPRRQNRRGRFFRPCLPDLSGWGS